VSLDNELFEGKAGTPGGTDGVVGPYGLGVRVPLLIVSPWSRGGWVCSEIFDHTSLIRFLERRFGVQEPNITAWRRAICGDLTSAFDFTGTDDRVPPLPSVAEYKPTGPAPPSFHPVPPANGSVPTQEQGVRLSRRLGYKLHVDFEASNGKLNLAFANHGKLGAHLQARSLTVGGGPYSYTIGAGHHITASLPNPGIYDLSLHGANGFFRHFAGSPQTTLRVEVRGDHDTGRLRVRIVNEHPGSRRHSTPVVVSVADAYGPDRHLSVGRGGEELVVDTHHSGGWYDLALTTPRDSRFRYQLAGRLESRGKLTSDPQLG
jgi:phospholipase C